MCFLHIFLSFGVFVLFCFFCKIHILFSFYLSEVYFPFYILCFVILCCFSVKEIDVAFLFFGWLLQLLEEKRKKSTRGT